MTQSLITLLFTAALAACGSTSPAAKTLPSEAAASGSPVVASSTPPSEPAVPPEPAKPAESPRPEPEKLAPAAIDPKAELLAAETSAWEAAKPVFTKYCATCHTKDGKKAAKKKLASFEEPSAVSSSRRAAALERRTPMSPGASPRSKCRPRGRDGAIPGRRW